MSTSEINVYPLTESNLRQLQSQQFDPYHFYDSKIPFIEKYINQQSHLAVTPMKSFISETESRLTSSGKSKRVHLMKDRSGCTSSDKKNHKSHNHCLSKSENTTIKGRSNAGANGNKIQKKNRLSVHMKLKISDNPLNIKSRLGIFNKGCSSSKAKIERRASLLSFDEDNFYSDLYVSEGNVKKKDTDLISSFFKSRKHLVTRDNAVDRSDLNQIDKSGLERNDDGQSVYSMDTFGRCSPGKALKKCSLDLFQEQSEIRKTPLRTALQSLTFPRAGPSAFKYSFRI